MSSIKRHRDISAAVKLISDWRSMAIVHAIYEHGPVRYKELDSLLAFSPTVLSGKLAQLVKIGVIVRQQTTGAKEVTYTAVPTAKDMVLAYHLLEGVNDALESNEIQYQYVRRMYESN